VRRDEKGVKIPTLSQNARQGWGNRSGGGHDIRRAFFFLQGTTRKKSTKEKT
jgi:hypothetical protein